MERQLIPYIQALFPHSPAVPVGNGDDAAVVCTTRHTAITVDTQIENVHFSWRWATAGRLGERLIGVVLSDLAAMGATPQYGILSLMVPSGFSMARAKAWLRGVQRRSATENFHIVGGDVTRAEAFGAVLTAFGAAPPSPLTRSGANRGDILCVSGPVGESAWELRALLSGRRKHARRWLTPPSRVTLGRCLAEDPRVTAGMDISDGLFLDARRMAEASGCGLKLDLNQIPLAATLARSLAGLPHGERTAILGGGEDYELLVAVKGGVGIPSGLTPIGTFTARRFSVKEHGESFPWPSCGHLHV